MIGLGFIVRVLQFCFYFAVAFVLLWLVVFVVSKVIQFFAGLLGHEIGDFGKWFFSKFKKNKKKKVEEVDNEE